MRIFIADSDQDLRVGLQVLLHQEAGMHVIGIAATGRGLPAQVRASQPEVLLIDWDLSGVPLIDLLPELCKLELPLRIIVLSVRPEDERAALSAGADDFFCTIRPADELVAMLSVLSRVE